VPVYIPAFAFDSLCLLMEGWPLGQAQLTWEICI